MTKAQLKQLIKEVLSEIDSSGLFINEYGDRHWLQPLDKSKITDIEFVNIDPKDSPDYKNAKIVMARYRPENNRKLTSDELEMLNKPYASADKEFFQNALKKAVMKRAERIAQYGEPKHKI